MVGKERKEIPKVAFSRFLKHSLEIVKNPLPFHHENFKTKGDTFRLMLGLKNSVIFSRDAAFLQYVLQKNHKKYTKSKLQTQDLAKYVGKGLLTSEGELWRTQRKLIQPAFHKKHLAELLKTMQSTIAEELDKLALNKPFDVFPIFNDLAFQVVAKALFSGAVNTKEIRRLQFITEAAQKMLVRELRQPYLNWWFRWGGALRRHMKLIEEARKLLRELVAIRKKQKNQQYDLLDMLLEATYEDGTHMKLEQLIDELLILFVAGHETTSNALTFTTQLLAKNTEWQKVIFEEATENKNNDLMVFLGALDHTKRVIEESMRLHPPVYFIDRVNLEDDEFGGMFFKKGTSLLFSVHEIHRSGTFWEHPNTFDPDRFRGPANQFSGWYYPFGAGPRMCIGNNFAMFEMQLAISHLVERYRILPKQDKIAFNPLITMKPKNAFLVFEKR